MLLASKDIAVHMFDSTRERLKYVYLEHKPHLTIFDGAISCQHVDADHHHKLRHWEWRQW